MERISCIPRVRFRRSLLCGAIAVMSIAGAQAVAGGNALAQEMPLTLSMSCAQTARLVKEQGGIVLRTGQYTYDRYVSSVRYCNLGDMLQPQWVPTQDNPQCFIGYRCYLPYMNVPD